MVGMTSGWLLILPAAHGQTTWHVATNGDDGATGTNWSSALQTPSNAVARAADGDTILVSNGTYQLTGLLSLTNGVALQSANGASNTTLRAAAGAQILLLNHAGATVEGFRFTGCSLDWQYHGAVKVQAGTMRNCIVSSNYIGDGAGVHLTGGLVTDCTISNNNSYWDSNGWGGGAYVAGGVMSNCLIVGNTAEMGGGVYLSGGLVTHCVITNNALDPYMGSQGGAGVRVAGGTLANCLVVRNRIGNTKSILGGGIYMTAGSIVYCTIADNSVASGYDGAGLYMTAGAVSNSIVYFNSSLYPAGGQENVYATGGSIVYSCTQPLTNAVGNIASLPDFVNRAGGDYRLQFGSACLDAGTNVAWIATDRDGTARAKDGNNDGTAQPDMGCYETDTPTNFQCSFNGTPLTGLLTVQAVFTAHVTGPGTDVVTYAWDYTNDGTNDLAGTPYAVVTNAYDVGIHSVKLTCVNSLGQTATVTRADYLTVYSDTAYVSPVGAHAAPYDTWAKAATNIQAALNAVYTPGTVVVSNGVYTLGEALNVNRAVTLIAANGASNTTLRVSGAIEILYLTHAGGVVDGFRLTGSDGLNWMYHGAVKVQAGTLRRCIVAGNRVGGGGGVHLIGGLVADCTITNNTAYWGSDADGAGVYITGGVLSNCVVAGNTAEDGGGVFLTAGQVTRCTITNNVSNPFGSTDGGGGVRMSGGVLANCLVARNRIGNSVSTNGGGVKVTGGSVLNCTIVRNTCAAGDTGAGLYLTAGGVTNTMADLNGVTQPAGTNQNIWLVGGSVAYSAMNPLVAGTGNLQGDLGFRAPLADNYQLSGASPCLGAGIVLPGMAGGMDLEGQPWVHSGCVNMGCYQTIVDRGTVFTVW